MNNEIIKVFVGCDPNNCDLEQMMVLDYSIKKHTTEPVEIIWMQLSRDPNSFWYSNPEKGEGWNTSVWVTPFSAFRWAIPEYCGFEGRAIYMDADIIVLDDLLKLWQHPIAGKSIVAAKSNSDMARLCTCVWDNKKAKKHLIPVEKLRTDSGAYKRLMSLIQKKPELVQPYEGSYNCIDGEDLALDEISILHYSDMGTQFSHKYSIPRLKKVGEDHWFDGEIMPHPRKDLSDLFDRYYNEALNAGYSLEDYKVEPFGKFPKRTQVDYKGNSVTRPIKQNFIKSLISKLTK